MSPAFPIEYPIAAVDAFDFVYDGARVKVEGHEITVMDARFDVQAVYQCDEIEFNPDGTTVGMLDGQTIVVRRIHGCRGCVAYRRSTK